MQLHLSVFFLGMRNEIVFNQTGRYFTAGNPTAKNLLVVLHGYGQLASYFLEKFSALNQENYFIVAPEGLHHFYVNGTNGRVGASWMTKEDRELDIKNYVTYLDAIFDKILATSNFEKKFLLGFSQGGATAARYMILGQTKFENFLLWAAVFPPDMKEAIAGNFCDSKNYFIVGDQDEFYKADEIKELSRNLISTQFPIDFVKFEGNHTIHIETLKLILNEK